MAEPPPGANAAEPEPTGGPPPLGYAPQAAPPGYGYVQPPAPGYGPPPRYSPPPPGYAQQAAPPGYGYVQPPAPGYGPPPALPYTASTTSTPWSALVLLILSGLSIIATGIIGIPSAVVAVLALRKNASDPPVALRQAVIGWVVYAVNALIGVILIGLLFWALSRS